MAGPVLLVDDDRGLLGWLSRSLQLNGYRVLCVRSRDELQIALENAPIPPRAAIVDFMLEGDSGFEVIEDLRLLKEPCASMLITGHADDDVYRRALLLGVVDFVVKPIELNELLRAVPRVIDTTRIWRKRKVALMRDRVAGPDEHQAEEHRNGTGEESHARMKASIERLVQSKKLSRRQAQILRLVVLGLRYSEIAERMNVTERTVKHHAALIHRALGARSRADLILKLL
ncbi:MAG: response regulator [Deltaproteobacteria bacterium]|nr:response regulator [Deltaproteobacteria bacterium]